PALRPAAHARRRRGAAAHGARAAPRMKRLFLLLLLSAASAVAAPPAPPAPSYAKRPEVKAFIRDMVQRHGFVERELVYLFSRVKREDPVLQFIRPPDRPPSWQDYRELFLSEKRIAAGVEFRAAHRALLERAEREYGVGQEYVLAIIGIETFYGRNMGR